ncbi:MAG: hypothetical protein MRY74_16160 [Neomegalonema sp.]|nr:hypothetical protein [Neomegalonema sp.]
MSKYTLLQWSELIANFSVIGGAFIVAFTIFQFRNTVQYGRAQLFLSLRENFARIREGLEREIPDFTDATLHTAYEDLTDRGKSAVTHYWTNAFNEWCATTKIYKSGRGILWRTFYANAQASALLHRPLREGLLVLMRGPYSFGGFKPNYMRVMRQVAKRLRRGRAGVILDARQRDEIDRFVEELDAIRFAR